MVEGINLHIGGQVKRDGWKILDAIPGPIVDYVGLCTDLSFLPNESCSEVYASHVLEHLGYDADLKICIDEVFRVLEHGGRFRFSVPDLDILCRLYVHPNLNAQERFHVMRMMFGGRTTPFDVHYSGLSHEFMNWQLHEAGFRGINRVRTLDVFDDTSNLTYAGTLISLNMVAIKP